MHPPGMNIGLVLCGIVLGLYCSRRYDEYPYFSLCGGAASVCFFVVAVFNTYGALRSLIIHWIEARSSLLGFGLITV
jgi:hypothetical protein